MPPGEEKAIEDKAEVKLRKLTGFYVQQEGNIHVAGHAVDIHGPGVILRPLGDATVRAQGDPTNIRRTRYHNR